MFAAQVEIFKLSLRLSCASMGSSETDEYSEEDRSQFLLDALSCLTMKNLRLLL